MGHLRYYCGHLPKSYLFLTLIYLYASTKYINLSLQIEISKIMVKRIMVTLNEEQYKKLETLKEFGNTDSERLRNVFLAYLSERGLIGVGKKEK